MKLGVDNVLVLKVHHCWIVTNIIRLLAFIILARLIND